MSGLRECGPGGSCPTCNPPPRWCQHCLEVQLEDDDEDHCPACVELLSEDVDEGTP